MLILLGLMPKKVQENKFIYPVTIFGTLVISILYTVDQLNVPLGFVKTALLKLPFFIVDFFRNLCKILRN